MQQESLVEFGSRRVIITITAIMCALLEIVDSTIVNVALNDMKGNMGATLSEVGWVITATIWPPELLCCFGGYIHHIFIFVR